MKLVSMLDAIGSIVLKAVQLKSHSPATDRVLPSSYVTLP